MSNRAQIDLSLGGGNDVIRALKDVLRAQQELRAEAKKTSEAKAEAEKPTSTLQTIELGVAALAFRSVTRAAVDYAKASNDIKPLNFAQSADRAKAFDDVVTRMAVRGGKNVEDLKTKFKQTSAEIGVMPERVAATARALTKLTYNTDTADAMKDLGNEANDTDRSIEEMGDLGGLLNTKLGVPLDKLGDSFDKIKSAAADLQTIGGHIALEDTLMRLSPELARFAGGVEHAAAVVATIGKGKSPEVAQRQAGVILSAISHADPILLDRVVKSELHDKNAKAYVTNANGDDVLRPDILEIVQHRAKRGRGGIRGLTRLLGNDVGAARALWDLDFDQVRATEDKTRRDNTPIPLPDDFTMGLDAGWKDYANQVNSSSSRKKVRTSKFISETAAGKRARIEGELDEVRLNSGEHIQGNRDKRNDEYQGHREAQVSADTTLGYMPPVMREAAEGVEAGYQEYKDKGKHAAAATIELGERSLHRITHALTGRNSHPAQAPAAKAVEDNKAHGRQWNNQWPSASLKFTKRSPSSPMGRRRCC